MKNYLLTTLFLFAVLVSLPAQRVSLTKTAEAVEVLQAENEALKEANEQLQTRVVTTDQRLDSIEKNVVAIVKEGKDSVKVPTTVEEALALHAFLSSIIVWLMMGALSKFLPPWLNKFVASLIVAAIVTAIAYFASGGEFTLAESIEFFVIVSGGSNIFHQMKKPEKETAPAPIPTPVLTA